MWLLRVPADPPFPLPAMCRSREGWQQLILGDADDKQAGPGLWHAVVRGVEHLRMAVVPGGVDLSQQPLVCWPARLVVVRERIDVLEHESPRSRLTQDAGVCLQQGGIRVQALTFPLQPEARLGERRTGGATNQQPRPLTCCKACSALNPASGSGHTVP